jgi:hypothetical protein
VLADVVRTGVMDRSARARKAGRWLVKLVVGLQTAHCAYPEVSWARPGPKLVVREDTGMLAALLD